MKTKSDDTSFVLFKLRHLQTINLTLLKRLVVFHGVDNTVGKGENAGYQEKEKNAVIQDLALFPQCFQKVLPFSGESKITVW